MSHADEVTVRRWFDAFNSRDLEAMLDCMDAHVDFQPLRLRGIDAMYHCHVGVRDWFADLVRMGHRHQIELAEVSPAAGDKVIAAGKLSTPDGDGPSSFCAVEHFEDGLIVLARHYLRDSFQLR
ncbi:MAG: nuclear transport factor 2 family protein [Thermoleophilia bacterium]